MTLEGKAARVIRMASADPVVVAESDEAIVVHETGRRPYPPVVYFPRSALRDASLIPAERKTHCPLKGTASYFHVAIGGEQVEEGVWSYEVVLDFHEGLQGLRDHIAFDARSFQVEYHGSHPVRLEPEE